MSRSWQQFKDELTGLFHDDLLEVFHGHWFSPLPPSWSGTPTGPEILAFSVLSEAQDHLGHD